MNGRVWLAQQDVARARCSADALAMATPVTPCPLMRPRHQAAGRWPSAAVAWEQAAASLCEYQPCRLMRTALGAPARAGQQVAAEIAGCAAHYLERPPLFVSDCEPCLRVSYKLMLHSRNYGRALRYDYRYDPKRLHTGIIIYNYIYTWYILSIYRVQYYIYM